ncbi:MAG TPA: TolC family protein, partial [Bacteroidia bacterium]
KISTLILFVLYSLAGKSQTDFSSIDSYFEYIKQKSTNIKSGNIKYDQAKNARLAALYGITDLTGNVSFTATDNTKLPISLFPAETFGGQPGEYIRIQTGIQYSNNLNEYAELKIINPQGWSSARLAKINLQSTEYDNKLTIKTLYENIATTYFNIVNLQEQLISTEKNLLAADSLYKIVESKFNAGLVKQQDLNDSKANYLNTEENVNQIKYLIKQQYIALKILSDIPENEDIKITQKVNFEIANPPTIEPNKLEYNSYLFKENVSRANYRQVRASLFPVVSIFASNSHQQYGSQFSLFDNNVSWINSNYIGFKASWSIPSANSITQISKARYDYLLARENTQHNLLKADLDVAQLSNDFDKAKSQATANKKIFDLREDSYKKNIENYTAGILNLDQTLNSFDSMVTSNYNYISSLINLMLAQTKIQINNNIK